MKVTNQPLVDVFNQNLQVEDVLMSCTREGCLVRLVDIDGVWMLEPLNVVMGSMVVVRNVKLPYHKIN